LDSDEGGDFDFLFLLFGELLGFLDDVVVVDILGDFGFGGGGVN